jgi:hypothetical protein
MFNVSWEGHDLFVTGLTWIARLHICRSLDGRFEKNKVVLPWFGMEKIQKEEKSIISESRTKTRTQLWTNIWCPYLYFTFARNTMDTVIIDASKEKTP